jgi:flavin-dependent dehydrogenase
MEMQNHNHYDVVVIGGGPAGSTLSTLLVQQGYQVLVIEREKFPRFHVGESLLVATQRIWEKLGIADSLMHCGQTFKFGAELRIGLDPKRSEYDTTIARFHNFPRERLQARPFAYQVERSQFDLFLLNHAQEQGVTVFEEAAVKEILWEGDKATGVRWRTKDGCEYTTQAECVADCSGRQAFIARSRDLLVRDKVIKTSAVFGHFKHVTRDPGIRQGYFNCYFIENGWFWFIPLHSDIMSIGLVMNEPETDWWSQKSPEEILLTYINRYKFIRDRFEHAEQFSEIRMLRALPYASKRVTGDGWILVGDASFFVDPLFSSGVHIAFESAEKAADAIDTFLKNKRHMKPFKDYEKWNKKEQFHVSTTMGMQYKLIKYQFATRMSINFCGKYSNHWDNPFLRRLVMWSNGYFEHFLWALYITWAFSTLLITISRLRAKILNKPGWETYTEFCSEPPLTIPKSAELLENGNRNAFPSPTAVHAARQA